MLFSDYQLKVEHSVQKLILPFHLIQQSVVSPRR